MSCCTNTLNLGCFYSCGNLKIDASSSATGTLTAVFTFAGISSAFSIDVEAGQPILFALSNLNENANYTGKLFDADGELYQIAIGEASYDCFSFKTSILYNSVAEVQADAGADCCTSKLITVSGETERVLLVTEWSEFGAIPSIEVIVKIDGVYTSIAANWVPDVMPAPTTITITLPGAPEDDWFIRLK